MADAIRVVGPVVAARVRPPSQGETTIDSVITSIATAADRAPRVTLPPVSIFTLIWYVLSVRLRLRPSFYLPICRNLGSHCWNVSGYHVVARAERL